MKCMNGMIPRSFNCKNEELPVVSGFVATSFERDLGFFSGYSPVFDSVYLDGYKAKIKAVEGLVYSGSETVALKLITEHSYSILDGLISPINHLEGYISLAGKKVPLSPADFGLNMLRKSVRSRDVENVLSQLRIVNANIKKFKAELTEKGLTETVIAMFTEAVPLLADDKKKGYELISNRAALVQNNMGTLNDLNDQLVSICDIGKILFKQTDKAKLKDYTFTQLMKKVRRTEKPEDTKPKDQIPPAENNETTEP